MVTLIVAEKPSVARDLARVLGVRGKGEGCLQGDRFWITWCVGHLVELCEPHEHDSTWRTWSAKTLPMLPDPFKLRPVKSGAKQLRVVERLMRSRDVSDVINACDAGREGELIFRLVAEHAGCRKPARRLWLSSLTDQAVHDAMSRLRPASAYDHLGDAARSRSEADWLVGLNATRALTLLARRGGGGELYTVGRVQTPTLAMLVRREEEIEAFVPEPFWQVRARFSVEQGAYVATWHRGKQDRLPSGDEADAIAAAVRGQTGVVSEVQQKTVRERPPLLFDLTSLQREANRRFGLSAAATLDAAQALYERHKLLTYPRTDSQHLTTDMVPKLPDVVRGVAVGPWAEHAARLLDAGPLPISRRVVDDAEVGDHHAIIPTGKRPTPDTLPPAERKVLDLVVRRFLAAFHEDAIFAATHIETEVRGHAFAARGRVMVQAGWLAVDPPPAKKKGDGEDATELPPVRRGEPAGVGEVRVHRGETQPPKRHSEATLLGAMERAGQELDEAELRRAMKESGLGTPATRASIIEGLLHRGFVQRDGKALVPTATGRALIGAVPVESLKSAALTGGWEKKLAEVAGGSLSRAEFMAGVRSLTGEIVGAILGAEPPPPARLSGEILGRCPVCATPVREGSRAYECERGRDCTFTIQKAVARRKVSPSLVQVLLARGASMSLKGFKSKAGKSFSARLALDETGQVVFRFGDDDRAAPGPRATRSRTASSAGPGSGAPARRRAGPAARTEDGAASPRVPRDGGAAPADTAPPRPRVRKPKTTTPPACPACAQGTIIRGHRGWGCSRWREGCGFVVWFEQGGRALPDDEADRLFRSGKTRLMDDMPGTGGAVIRARLVLDLSAEGNVRLQPAARTSSSRRGSPSTTT